MSLRLLMGHASAPLLTCPALSPARGVQMGFTAESLAPEVSAALPKELERDSAFLTHPVFNS